MPLSGAGWPVWRGLGLFLGDLPQVRLPLRLVLVLGPGQGRSLFLGYLRLSLGRTAWASAAFFRSLSAFARTHSAFPGGSRPVWLLTPPSIMMLATFLLSPMTTAF
jgi:hypothetical protein